MFPPIKKKNRYFSSFLSVTLLLLFSANSWATSAGCTAVNNGTFDVTVTAASDRNLGPFNFEAGEVLTFTFTNSPNANIEDVTAGPLNIVTNGVPVSSVDYTIPATGARQFRFVHNGGGADIVFSTTCGVETGGENAQNDVITGAMQQSNNLGDLVNRNVNTFTGEELGDVNRFTYLSAVNDTSIALSSHSQNTSDNIFSNLFADGSIAHLETENFAVVMNAAAQYSTDSINRALRMTNLQQYFIFTDISGVLTFDDRGSRERTGETITGGAGFGYHYSDQFTFGVAGSYSVFDRPFAADTGETESNSFIINPFVSYKAENGLLWTINAGFGLQDNELSTGTTVTEFDSWSTNIAAAVQGNWRAASFTLNPRGTITYDYVDVDGFTGTSGVDETESVGALHFDLGVVNDGFDVSPSLYFLPFINLELDWAFKRPDSFVLANGSSFRSNSVVAEISGGGRFVNEAGMEFLFEGGYGMIGEEDIDEVHFNMQLYHDF
jgi:autotransporter-like protein